MARTRSWPSSSKQPTWTPARMTKGSPASIRRAAARGVVSARSISPAAIFSKVARPRAQTYWTSEKPSARRSASATWNGASQRFGSFFSLSRVVSADGSAAPAGSGTPRRPPAAARPTLLTNSRRLKRTAGCLFTDRASSLPPLVGRLPSRVGGTTRVGTPGGRTSPKETAVGRSWRTHTQARGVAHSTQNLAAVSFSCWHRGHFMRTPHAPGAAQVWRR